MRVGVICCPKDNNFGNLMEVSNAIGQGLEGNGATVEVLNAQTDSNRRLTPFDYLVFVSEPLSALSGKVPPYIGKYIENSGSVSGKRAATVIVGGLLKQKAMSQLMKVVEGQGIILKTSEFIKSAGEAKAFGSHLNVERNYR